MTSERGRFAGVLAILRYNTRFYAASLGGLAVIGLAVWFRFFPRWMESLLIAAAIPMVFWSITSLLASWYVYDHAGVTRWQWVPQALMTPPRRWLTIHAGLDEATPTLKRLFPETAAMVVDIYDPREMTEPSIARARELASSAAPAVPGRLDTLPLPDGDRDTVFLLFAAHEIRDRARRTQLLREVARVLAAGGQVLLVEHLRDWRNFVAFGPGFLHFHSRREWLRAADEAGLRVERERSVTPLVRCFLLRKAEP